MTTSNERLPLEGVLSTALETEMKLDDDGRPVLEVRDGTTILERISARSDDHNDTLAGLRKLMDGLWLLHMTVAGQKYQAEHVDRIRSGEIAVVDSEGLADADVAEARIRELRGTGPSISGAF